MSNAQLDGIFLFIVILSGIGLICYFIFNYLENNIKSMTNWLVGIVMFIGLTATEITRLHLGFTDFFMVLISLGAFTFVTLIWYVLTSYLDNTCADGNKLFFEKCLIVTLSIILMLVFITGYINAPADASGLIQDIKTQMEKANPSEEQKIAILKDFYDGKPVPRSQAFWEYERGKPGWRMVPEIMAQKYGLSINDVMSKINDLDNQRLVYSPGYQPPLNQIEVNQ